MHSGSSVGWQLFPQPPALAPQKYRHVDNIMFENHTVADRFLDFWRKTGNQHFGYLYGRYTEHKDIPLGIRAEVAAIYEPPQVGLGTYSQSGVPAESCGRPGAWLVAPRTHCMLFLVCHLCPGSLPSCPVTQLLQLL